MESYCLEGHCPLGQLDGSRCSRNAPEEIRLRSTSNIQRVAKMLVRRALAQAQIPLSATLRIVQWRTLKLSQFAYLELAMSSFDRR